MLQVLNSLEDGHIELADVPVPQSTRTSVVIETRASVLSAGTERMLVEFGRSGVIGKMRSEPDRVRQVIQKARTDGLGPTLGAVRAKLAVPIPLGYCQAGIAVDVGSGVAGIAEGDAVVSNGPHAEYVRVPSTLVARIPENVPFEAAAFGPLAAIGLQGLRLAQPTLGETLIVYGLGLIGLLTVQLARASGCHVIGIDRSEERCAMAARFGASVIASSDTAEVVEFVMQQTRGVGADAVLLTLATDADEPVHAAAEMSRKRGRIVLVGVAGLQLRRDDFYRKELSFQVSCSYGPGRYDPSHEEGGADYPLPFVRWTEGRNIAAAVELMGDGRLDPLSLITHRVPIAEAASAYDLISSGAPSLGIILTYPEKPAKQHLAGRTVTLAPARQLAGKGVVGWIGAGSFSSGVLIPAFAAAGASFELIASSGGTSAMIAATGRGAEPRFRRATSSADSVLADAAVDTIVVATRHDSHADLVTRGLDRGKHVFCEKPLALTEVDVDRVANALGHGGTLCVGFNRRFAPDVQSVAPVIARRAGPLVANITVNAGRLPRDHWTMDPTIGGGRMVGECCHFIDLARALTGSPCTRLQVVTAAGGTGVSEDIAVLGLGFADGSIASIQYLANGNRGYPKERVELFWDGKVVRLDNFRRVTSWGVDVQSRSRFSSQDKGHKALVKAFVASVRGEAAPPIPADEILEVSRLAVRAGDLARSGGGTWEA